MRLISRTEYEINKALADVLPQVPCVLGLFVDPSHCPRSGQAFLIRRDNLVYLAWRFGREDKVAVADAVVGEGVLGVGHVGGDAVVDDIAMVGGTQDGEDGAAAVGQCRTAGIARLAVGNLADDALFQQHEWNTAVDDGTDGTADVADAGERQFGREDGGGKGTL